MMRDTRLAPSTRPDRELPRGAGGSATITVLFTKTYTAITNIQARGGTEPRLGWKLSAERTALPFSR